jgi:hypothetical protein
MAFRGGDQSHLHGLPFVVESLCGRLRGRIIVVRLRRMRGPVVPAHVLDHYEAGELLVRHVLRTARGTVLPTALLGLLLELPEGKLVRSR